MCLPINYRFALVPKIMASANVGIITSTREIPSKKGGEVNSIEILNSCRMNRRLRIEIVTGELFIMPREGVK